MKDVFKIALGIFLGVVAVTACAICAIIGFSAGGLAFLVNIISTPTPEFYPASPTPSLTDQIVNGIDKLSPSLPWGQPNKIDVFEVTTDEYELLGNYKLEDGEIVTPTLGAAFLWVHVSAENIGNNAGDTFFMFKLYYKGETIDDTAMGYYKAINYPSFRSDKVYPKQKKDGWVLFEVRKAIDLSHAYFLIKPLFGDYTVWNFPME